MATVSNALQSSVALKSVVASMNLTALTMERLDVTANKLDLGQSFEIARQKIGLVNIGLNYMSSEIVQSANEQENLNNKIKDGSKEAKILKDVFKKLGGFETIKKVVKISDEWAQSNAKFNLIVDDGGSVEELRMKIFSSAQSSRALYTDMLSSVTKLGLSAGDKFNNTDEIIKFTEMVQKMGTISGFDKAQSSDVANKINQTMASGQLKGSDYGSIVQSMPILEKAIADYMGVGSDELEKLAEQGKITSDIIKAAMFGVSDEIDSEFNKMPMTWGQVWNDIVNNILMYAQPILEFINFLANNWSIIEPIILGVAAAWGVYIIAVNSAKIAEIAQAVWTGITIAAKVVGTTVTLLFTRATLSQAAAQHGLNTALLACPLAWMIILIIGLIAIFYAVIAAVNKFAGTTLSATGLIVGSFYGLYSFIYNIIAMLYNLWMTFSDFISNLFIDPVSAIKVLFLDLCITVLGWLSSLATSLKEMINLIPGIEMNTESGFEGTLEYLENVKKGIVDEKKLVSSPKWEYMSASEMFNDGYNFGKIIEDKLSNSFSFDDMNNFDVPGIDALNADDLSNVLDNQEYDVNVKDEVNLADESLKYLLDEVTQKYINNINLQAPAPNVSVQIDVANGSDLDLDELAEKTKQKIGTEILEFSMSSTDIKH